VLIADPKKNIIVDCLKMAVIESRNCYFISLLGPQEKLIGLCGIHESPFLTKKSRFCSVFHPKSKINADC
jgi:hypothetical protein